MGGYTELRLRGTQVHDLVFGYTRGARSDVGKVTRQTELSDYRRKQGANNIARTIMILVVPATRASLGTFGSPSQSGAVSLFHPSLMTIGTRLGTATWST
jgi:hypothetical protein